MTIICAWCDKEMGQKDGQGQEGVTHGMCDECAAKQPEKATPHREMAQ